MAASSQQYLLPSMIYADDLRDVEAAIKSSPSEPTSSLLFLSPKQREKRPASTSPAPLQQPQGSVSKTAPKHHVSDLKAQTQTSERTGLLDSNYPVRQLNGCCRCILQLPIEFDLYNEANEAGMKVLPFHKKYHDLEQCVKNCDMILSTLKYTPSQPTGTPPTPPLHPASRLRHWVDAIAPKLKPGLSRDQKNDMEKYYYASELRDDFQFVAGKLKARDAIFRSMYKAIEGTLTPESMRLLNYSGYTLEPLRLTDDLRARIRHREKNWNVEVANARYKDPIKQVKQAWKKQMSHILSPVELASAWDRCFVGSMVTTDEEDAAQKAGMAWKAENPASLEFEPITKPVDYSDHRFGEGNAHTKWRGASGGKVFIVVGWFPGTLHEPVEACLTVQDKECFLRELEEHIIAVRGWRRVFSLKTIQGFELYKCHPKEGGHSTLEASPSDKTALSQLFNAVSDPASYTPQDNIDWAAWVSQSFNKSQKYPYRAELSLRVVIKWSQLKLICAATIVLLLSLAVGFWYMAVHDGTEGTSAAWTIASYIVTAGAFIIALLAGVSYLKDG